MEYIVDDKKLDAFTFIAFVKQVWQGNYDIEKTQCALSQTINITAYENEALIGCLRILTDGYYFGTITELLVLPEYQKQGVGSKLLQLAKDNTPTMLYFGAQPGIEKFYEKNGCKKKLAILCDRKGTVITKIYEVLSMEVKKIDDTQITNAIDLIWQTFLQFEAPDYSEEGVKSFQDFIENKEIIKTLEFWGAYDEEELKGVIATNENRKHICCFFVKAQYQRQGIGRKLWDFLRENSSSKTITVNSSPYAVPVYHKLGFVDTDTEQLSDGMRYTPMQFIK